MKKISTLLLLAMAAALLSGCKTGRAEEDEPSDVATINVDPNVTFSSSDGVSSPAPVQPVENDPNGDESSQTPPESSEVSESTESRDYDPNAYYTYMTKGAGVMIMGGENEQEKIVIPAAINERTVVSISGSARKTLFPKAKTIILPETLTDIHSYAFAGCTYLSDIKIPSGVSEIGENAFLNCASLAELEIPASVEKIEANAFSGCAALSDLKLSDGLKKIGAGAFGGCTSLTSIELPDSVNSIAYGAFDSNVEFSLTYKGMTFNAYNINDLYTMLS